MQKIFVLFALLLTLSGCSIFQVHKMNIEQGNIVEPAMVNRLHLGMTESDVKNIMGSPILLNTFADNRIDYVYTFKSGDGSKQTEKYVTLIFRNHRLNKIDGNMYSQFMR